ncbi:HAD-IA family hydrolase [Methylopila henanensis]|uniref:HAD-IA family hydrolase n=1 Tax=Methylopila henanensis TaxID=873516 RepID=A0ABW4K3K8_9HYPH
MRGIPAATRQEGPMLVVFDVDGTLVDSQHAIVAAMTEAYVGNGLAAPSREAILGIVGLSVPEAVAVLSASGLDHPVAAIGDAYKAAFNRARTAAPKADPLYPGAREALAALAARGDVLLGLATGNSRRGVERFIDTFGFHGVFATTQSADDAPSKPHPGMLLLACAEAGVTPEETVMIGDTTFDMQMARAAGARAIGVAWGYHPPERLAAAGAHTVLSRFDDLIPALSLPQAEATA